VRAGRDFIGRDTQFAVVAGLVEQVANGATVGLRVLAEPGTGLTEFLREVAARHTERLEVRIVAAEDLPGQYAIALDLLGLPELSLESGVGGRRSFFEAGVPGAANAVAVEMLLRRTEVVVRERPQLWVVDDAHLAGRGALAWLADLLRAGSLPVGVVYGTHDPALALLAGEPEIELPGLTDAEVVELLTRALGAPPSAALAAAFAGAAGSPRAITAALATLDPGAVVTSSGTAEVAPDRLAELVAVVPDALAQRLRALVGDSLLVTAAAVAGPRFVVADVAAVLGEPLRECIAGLGALEAAGLIAADGNAYRFVRGHDRRAALDACPGPVRAALHAELAQLLMARDDDPVRVAEHLVAAGTRVAGDVEWLTSAAERIVRFDAHSAAALLDRAVALTADPPRRLSVARARALSTVGRVAEAEVLADVLLADATGDEAALLHRDRAMSYFHQGRAADTVSALNAAAEWAVDPRLQARMTAECAMSRMLAADFANARETAYLGSKRGEAIGDPVTVLAAEMVGCLVAFYDFDIPEAIRLAERLESLGELPEAAEAALYQPWFAASLVRLEMAEYAHSRRLNATGRARALESGYLWMAPAYDALDAYAAWEAGELDDAAASAAAAIAWGLDDTFGTTIWCHAFLGRIAAARGDWAAASAEAEACRPLIIQGQAQFGWDHLALVDADLAVHAGATETAYGALREIWEVFAAFDLASPRQRLGVALVPMLAEHGDREFAAAVLADLADSARRTGLAGYRADHAYASAWEARDPATLERCAESYWRNGNRLRCGRTLVDAALLAEPGDRGEARRLAGAAEDVLGPQGAEGDLAAVRHLLNVRRPPKRRAGGLSPTERAVVDLVADGLTNTEIAERLYVSRRTVESHVSAAYRKLGVTNRVELARAARISAS
jgi:DNA-binding CsgD family transcriptional regulator